MKVLMFLPSVNAGLTYVHAGCFALIDDLAYDLIGIVTSVKEEAGKYYRGAPVYYMKKARNLDADILVFPKIFGFIGFNIIELLNKLINEYRFPKEKIVYDDYLLKKYMTTKYETSTDPDIQASLKYWQSHELDPFNQYMANSDDTFDEVFFDDKVDLPYIFFETIAGKRLKMYYPKNHPNFEMKGGKPYIKNILQEQIPTSPHLYTTDAHKVEDGDIIIDAGVCEGNFSLRYVDIASKFYLFENNANWIEPLYHTFTAAKIDGNIFPKGVGSETNDNCVRIDEVVDYTRGGMKYFLKMDVEGFEQAGLKGADKILRTGRVKSSICAYHNYDDEIRIKNILKKYGYKTSTSKGYMTMIYKDNFWVTRDFRRGIVYGDI